MTNRLFNWNAPEVERGLEVVSKLRRPMLERLKLHLDEYHGTSRSFEYYDLIAGIWLEAFTQNVYTSWREVVEGNLPGPTVPTTLIKCVPHFFHMRNQSGWHLQLRKAIYRLLQSKRVSNWEISQDKAEITVGNQNKRNKLKLSILSFSSNRPKVLLTAPGFRCSNKQQLSTLWRWRDWVSQDDLNYHQSVFIQADCLWRKTKSLEADDQSGSFDSIVKSLLPLYIPAEFLEGFAKIRSSILKLPISRPNCIFSSSALHDNTNFKFLAAEWRDEGTKLLYHQHGGGYGIEKDLTIENSEIRLSDQFFSWGWTKGDAKVTPLSPAMSFLPRKPRGHRILFQTLDMPQVPYKLIFNPMNREVEAMHREAEVFLRELPVSTSITIRPYPFDFGWGSADRMKNAAAHAQFDNSTLNSFERYQQFSIVVLNYLGTSWLETIGVGIPTICFYDPAIWIFREESTPYIEALLSTGVLHHSGKAAANFIKSLGDDVEGWWNNYEVREACNSFRTKYANFSPEWEKQWENEFSKFID